MMVGRGISRRGGIGRSSLPTAARDWPPAPTVRTKAVRDIGFGGYGLPPPTIDVPVCTIQPRGPQADAGEAQPGARLARRCRSLPRRFHGPSRAITAPSSKALQILRSVRAVLECAGPSLRCDLNTTARAFVSLQSNEVVNSVLQRWPSRLGRQRHPATLFANIHAHRSDWTPVSGWEPHRVRRLGRR